MRTEEHFVSMPFSDWNSNGPTKTRFILEAVDQDSVLVQSVLQTFTVLGLRLTDILDTETEACLGEYSDSSWGGWDCARLVFDQHLASH